VTAPDPDRRTTTAPLAPSPHGIFQAIVESSPTAVLVVDAAGVIVFANPEAGRLFDYQSDELIGSPVDRLIPVRWRDAHAAHRQAFAARPGRRAMGEGRDLYGLRRDGREVPVEIGLNPLPTADGLLVVASIVDLTARRAAEERFRIAVEASPHGMLMVDPTGVIVLVNRETERLFGYTRDELIGEPVELLVPHQAGGRHPDLRTAFADTPSRRPMGASRDLRGRRRDGSEIPVEIGLNPIRTDDGLFVLASIVDIGPRKRAEQELRRSNEELERFAYVASHDLQEPLRTVSGFLQLLARRYRQRLDPEGLEYIEFAVDGANRMQRLIEDLLTFSRVGTRGALVPTDLDQVFRRVTLDLHASLEASGATLTHLPLPTVLGDRPELEQLLTNLIGNAIKFRGPEPPRVHVQADREGPDWLCQVRDNGIGIDARYFERIFVVFQRLHGRDEYPGTGIGLALCKKIVERHGGRLWVQSRPGQGATFFFTLRAADAP